MRLPIRRIPSTFNFWRFAVLVLFWAAGSALLAGCTAMSISYDYDKKASFKDYKTFDVYRPDPSSFQTVNYVLPEQQQGIEDLIVSEMVSRGYTRTTSNPDLVVTYHLKAENKQKAYTTTTSVGVGFGGYYGGVGYGVGNTQTNYEHYRQGTLIIDMIDFSTQSLVWHGAAVDELKDSNIGTQAKVDAAIRQIFQRYRWKAKS